MMDNATLVTIIWSIIGGIATMLLGLVAWGLKVQITTTFENTVQIRLLNQHIESLLKLPSKVEKLEKDIFVAHKRIKEMYKPGGDNGT